MSFWDKTYYGNTILEYAISLGIILGAVVAAKILYWISKTVIKKLTARTKTKLDDILVDKLEEPVVFGVILYGAWYAISNRLSFPKSFLTADEYSEMIIERTGNPPTPDQIEAGIQVPYPYWDNFFHHLFAFLFVINVTWLLVRTVDALIQEYIVPMTEKTESDLDDQLLPIFRKGLKAIFWVLGAVVALNNAGFNVGAIVAGLGIGGLAFALAAQDTVKNFFGGVMIFADKPFKIGERIKINGIDGFVKEIGIRSTRITTLEGRMVTIPNSQFSDNAVENIDIEPSRKIVLNLGLTYDTRPDQMEQAMTILKGLGTDYKDLIDEEVLVSFNAFGDFSLGILFIYYIKKESDILQTQSTINLQILKRFNENGLEMAFPTQTVYHQAITKA